LSEKTDRPVGMFPVVYIESDFGCQRFLIHQNLLRNYKIVGLTIPCTVYISITPQLIENAQLCVTCYQLFVNNILLTRYFYISIHHK
jgi:hypothetical protein